MLMNLTEKAFHSGCLNCDLALIKIAQFGVKSRLNNALFLITVLVLNKGELINQISSIIDSCRYSYESNIQF